MFYSGPVNFKLKRKSGIFENSTGSCRYNPATREGFSYGEKIIFFDKKLNVYVVNTYKFSVTTSNHRDYLEAALIKGSAKSIRVSSPTFNGITKIKDLKEIRYYCDNAAKYLTKKQKRNCELFQNEHAAREAKQSKDKRRYSLLLGKTKTSDNNYLKHFLAEFSGMTDANYKLTGCLEYLYLDLVDKSLLSFLLKDKAAKSILLLALDYVNSGYFKDRWPKNFDNLENQNALLSLAE